MKTVYSSHWSVGSREKKQAAGGKAWSFEINRESNSKPKERTHPNSENPQRLIRWERRMAK